MLTSTPPASSPSPYTTPRASHIQGSARFAPYPARDRLLPRVSSSPADGQQPVSSATTEEQLYQLVVRPIIKSTIGQRDTSGDTLNDAVVNGNSFNEIIQKLWDLFSFRVKRRAVKTDGEWSTEPVDAAQWDKVMQFKVKRHIVDSTKSDHAWCQWMVKTRGETVTLLVYEYGIAITRAQDLDSFKEACIRPEQTDRAGATAEIVLQDVVARLQEEWGSTFRAESVVWRMWANHITRNLNRSTWEDMISQPPPEYVANLLQSSESRLERHLSSLAQSANVALNCVQGSLAEYGQLRRDWEAFGRRLQEHERHLETRKTIIEAFIQDIVPPALSDVADPLLELTNMDDVDHAE